MRFLLYILFAWSIVVSWCSSNATQTIEFLQFSFPSPVAEPVVNTGVLAEYIVQNKQWTGDSLVIIQTIIDPSASFDIWVTSTIDMTKKNYPEVSFVSQEAQNFDCDSQNISGSLVQRSLVRPTVINTDTTTNTQDPLYFAQYFFIHNADAFVLSYASTSDSAVAHMIDNRNKLSCIKKE